MYIKQQFGKELKEKINKKVDIYDIGRWSYSMYYEHMLEIDDDFREFLINLNAMEDGPEFERSYEELEDIADRLIAGKDVQL